jgi:hypothetical protein
VEVLHQVWFELELIEGIYLYCWFAAYQNWSDRCGTNRGLKFLIGEDSSIHPPLDDIKILSIGIRARNFDSSFTAWRKYFDNI